MKRNAVFSPFFPLPRIIDIWSFLFQSKSPPLCHCLVFYFTAASTSVTSRIYCPCKLLTLPYRLLHLPTLVLLLFQPLSINPPFCFLFSSQRPSPGPQHNLQLFTSSRERKKSARHVPCVRLHAVNFRARISPARNTQTPVQSRLVTLLRLACWSSAERTTCCLVPTGQHTDVCVSRVLENIGGELSDSQSFLRSKSAEERVTRVGQLVLGS